MAKKRSKSDNFQLDAQICEDIGITIDELDEINLSVVEKLRELYWRN